MNETYDKTTPVHDPTPPAEGPREIFPYVTTGDDKDFRPINTVEYPEDEVAEVEEVLTAPKDSPVQESADSSTSEQTPENGLSVSPEETVPVEKDSGLPKENEPGTPTSLSPTTTGETEQPAKTPGLPESMIPSFPAKQS
jgi:hypothetical protein